MSELNAMFFYRLHSLVVLKLIYRDLLCRNTFRYLSQLSIHIHNLLNLTHDKLHHVHFDLV